MFKNRHILLQRFQLSSSTDNSNFPTGGYVYYSCENIIRSAGDAGERRQNACFINGKSKNISMIKAATGEGFYSKICAEIFKTP